MSPEITKMLTVSSGHISGDTAELLRREPDDNKLCLSVYDKAGFGWFIYITPGQDCSALPPDLKALIGKALSLGCGVLCLDSDGPEIDGLALYDW